MSGIYPMYSAAYIRIITGRIRSMAVLVMIVILAAAELVLLGALGGIGPLKFTRDWVLAGHPGNAKKYNIENILPSASSPLKGKRFLFLGSSVTFGAASMQCSMADYIRVLDSCDVVKEAVNGTTLADIGPQSYLSRLMTVDTAQHFDAVIVQLSTNDATKKLPLGVIIESTDPIDFDTKTVVGSMEAIIARCKEKWNCPVIFYTGTRYSSKEYQAMVDALYRLQPKWGLGIIDLWNDAEMNAVEKEDYELYMHDKIHPTKAGYLVWWVPKFRAYLHKIFGEQRSLKG